MAPGACAVVIDPVQRERLQALVRSRTAPVREVQRARIVLAAGDGASNAAIARTLSISQNTVRTWRGRFAEHGIAGLGDRPRPGRPLVYGPLVRLRIVATVTSQLPEADSVWSHRLLADHLAADGISASQIGRILADLRSGSQTSPGPRLADPPRRPRLLHQGRRRVRPLPAPTRRVSGDLHRREDRHRRPQP